GNLSPSPRRESLVVARKTLESLPPIAYQSSTPATRRHVTNISPSQQRGPADVSAVGRERHVAEMIPEGHVAGIDRPVAEIRLADRPSGRATLKVDRYNGVTHLLNNLEGAAEQILCELSLTPTEDEVRRLLKSRFGTENQQIRYRAELKARRQRLNESIPTLYSDIRRLLSLAYPGESGKLYETTGCEYFLDALADRTLRIRVMDRSPKNLEEAYNLACHMQAYTSSESMEGKAAVGKLVRHVAVEPSQQQQQLKLAVDNRVNQLEQSNRALMQEMRQMRADLATATANIVANRSLPTTPWVQPPAVQS